MKQLSVSTATVSLSSLLTELQAINTNTDGLQITSDSIDLSNTTIQTNTDDLEELIDSTSISQIHSKILAADNKDINFNHDDIGTATERITSITYDGTIDLVIAGVITPTAKQTTDTLSYTDTSGVFTLNRNQRSVTL